MTSAASASASVTTIPAAAAARRPFVESSTAAASAGSTPSRHVAVRYVRRRLARDDFLTRDGDGEAVGDSRPFEHNVDQRAIRRRRQPKRPAVREPSDRCDRPRQQRQAAPVLIEQRGDHEFVDLLGLKQHAECR